MPLIPRLHLPRSSYDLFVYDFLYDFFDVVGGYMLSIARCQYGDLAEVGTLTVQLSCNYVHGFKRPSMFIFGYTFELCFKVM